MIGFMPAVGALVRRTDGSWMTRPPRNCPAGHRLEPGRMLVGHQPCSTCRGGHTTWTCLDCRGMAYGPPLTAGCGQSTRGAHPAAHPPRLSRAAARPAPEPHDGCGGELGEAFPGMRFGDATKLASA